jgi:hypothetical protein
MHHHLLSLVEYLGVAAPGVDLAPALGPTRLALSRSRGSFGLALSVLVLVEREERRRLECQFPSAFGGSTAMVPWAI